MSRYTGSEYSDVLLRVRAWVAKQDSQFDIWRPRWQLEPETPGSTLANGNLHPTYMAQVLRAVNVLVSEGTLAKIGKGRDAIYTTPEAHAKHMAEVEQARKALEVRRQSWHDVKGRLAVLGYTDVSASPTDIRLELGTWRALLPKLERVLGEGS